MDEMNFIPYWYYEKIRNRKIRMFNILCVILLVCDIAVLYHCIFNVKKYKYISEYIKTETDSITDMKKNLQYIVRPQYDINKTLNVFVDYIQGKVAYSNAEISGKSMNIQVPITSRNAHSDYINILDSIQQVSIVEMDLGNNEKSSENMLKVELKTK